MHMVKNLGIIPARFGSTRFPGKPLAKIGGISMIERVYKQALLSELDRVVVATDDERIMECVSSFGGEAIMTHTDIHTGTERCREALKKSGLDPENIINIQGDEPFIDPGQINSIIKLLYKPDVDIATMISPALSFEEVVNENRVKVVVAHSGKALYFSRSVIPFATKSRQQIEDYFIHLGIYGFKKSVLLALGNVKPGYLERAESLEQLTWLENGFEIFTVQTMERNDSVDTPEDLQNLERKFFL